MPKVRVVGSTRTLVTSVTSSASSVLLLKASQDRYCVSIFNESTAILYLKLSNGPASLTSYTVQVTPSGYYEAPYNYGGDIYGIWGSANGAARITEYL